MFQDDEWTRGANLNCDGFPDACAWFVHTSQAQTVCDLLERDPETIRGIRIRHGLWRIPQTMPTKEFKFSHRSFFGKIRQFGENIFPRPMWDQTNHARPRLGETFQPKMFIFKDNCLMAVEVSVLHNDNLSRKTDFRKCQVYGRISHGI